MRNTGGRGIPIDLEFWLIRDTGALGTLLSKEKLGDY
jgi:hypothetical protein